MVASNTCPWLTLHTEKAHNKLFIASKFLSYSLNVFNYNIFDTLLCDTLLLPFLLVPTRVTFLSSILLKT